MYESFSRDNFTEFHVIRQASKSMNMKKMKTQKYIKLQRANNKQTKATTAT